MIVFKHIILTLFILTNFHFQESDLTNILISLKNLEFENAKHLSEELVEDEWIYLHRLISLYQLNDVELPYANNENNFNESSLTSQQRIIRSISNGYQKSLAQGTRAKAFKDLNIAYEESLKINDKELQKASLLGIFKVLNAGFTQKDFSFVYYLNLYKELISDDTDKFWYYFYQIELYDQTTDYHENKHDNRDFLIDQLASLNKLQQSLSGKSRIMFLINKMNGNYYVKYDGIKAKEWYLEAKKKMDSNPYFNSQKFRIQVDLARSEAIQGKTNKAINILHQSKEFFDLGNKTVNLLNYNFFLSEFHSKSKQFDSANFYLRNVYKLEKKLNFNLHNQEISRLEVELQTTEKEKENLRLKADNLEIKNKRKQNRNLLFGSLGLILFGSITFILIQINTKRKQLLAEQEKELQTQKLAAVLKEQELTSIDAMIEGQEKERQRIANDLHDDLGGLMATVKLHFNALKEMQSPELYKKTDKLLDEAYHKIRSVAHTKNSGVMAKKGLLKAINDMAKTISASNKLHIDVIDHGLEHRLENSLELTIFRIIQELITNIIKHAEATEATIHITNHDDSLNIMVEDNGKGFNPKTITKNAGMGIHSIDKRIENLGGTVTIESEHKKGTTVIIDIPS